MFNLPEPFAWIDIPAGEVEIEQHIYPVQPFHISKYPITNAQFALFIEDGGYQNPRHWTGAGWQLREKQGWTEPHHWHDAKWNGAECPVVGISWYEALAFCQWLGTKTNSNISLPTEQQWQRAAQGDDGRTVPWGVDWDDDRRDLYCNVTIYLPWGAHHPSPVRQYEGKGDSPFGVVDMLGNVWEWTLTEFESTESTSTTGKQRVLRGGWNAYAWITDLTVRDHLPQGYKAGLEGFRLARTAN